MQDSDPNAQNYFNNRRALVGPACMVNSVFDGVQVLSGVSNLQNICNEDLDDYASFTKLADVVAVGSPIISIKDVHCYYAGGTEAGFTICAKSDASLLSLNIADLYQIQFFKDGKSLGNPCNVETDKGVTGLGLSLLNIPGSDMINKTFKATAPGDFDEIKLIRLGVDVDAISSLHVKYAFVGKAREYTITNNNENGISQYAKDNNRKDITLNADKKLIDADLTNSVPGAVSLVPIAVSVEAIPTDGKEVFPAGTEIGFRYNVADALNIGLGKNTKITLYSKEKKKVLLTEENIKTEEYTVSVEVLSVGVVKGKKDAEVVIKATKPFSKAEIFFGGLNIKLGVTNVNYAFVRMAPDKASHHCPIEATAGREVCGCENEFMLQHNPKVDVTWSVVEQPNGSNVILDPKSGNVTDIYVPGKYTFRATASDGCWEETTINYAPHVSPAEQGVALLVNNEGAGKTKYVLSGNDGGALLKIFGSTEESNKILSSDLNSCAAVQPGVTLAGLKDIVGIKTADNSHIVGNVFDYKKHKMKAGFVVSSKVTGLNLDVLTFFTIELRKNGVKVINEPTTHWGAISAGLIGSETPHKIRLTIDVPDGCDFDEIVLQDAGVLGADLSKLNSVC